MARRNPRISKVRTHPRVEPHDARARTPNDAIEADVKARNRAREFLGCRFQCLKIGDEKAVGWYGSNKIVLVNAPIYRGADSLLLSVIAGEPDIVAVLLDAGAKPDGGVKKLTNWSRSDVRRFLKKHAFKRTSGTVPETWVRTSPEGTTNTIVLPEMRGNYTLPDLTRIVKESGLDAGIWMGLQEK